MSGDQSTSGEANITAMLLTISFVFVILTDNVKFYFYSVNKILISLYFNSLPIIERHLPLDWSQQKDIISFYPISNYLVPEYIHQIKLPFHITQFHILCNS